MLLRLSSAAVAAALLLGGCGAEDSSGERGRVARPASESPGPSAIASGSDSGDAAKEENSKKAKGGSTKAAVASKQVRVIDTAFAPTEVTVSAGDMVEWRQTGFQPHSVTSSNDLFDSDPRCGPLRTDDCMGEGDSFSFVFDKPGTYAYYCRVHGLPDGIGMTGVIEVR